MTTPELRAHETYAAGLPETAQPLYLALGEQLVAGLPQAEVRVWHGAPVWFDQGEPLVGLTLTRRGVQLLFWSGQLFDEPGLRATGNFKASERLYQAIADIEPADLQRWLAKALSIKWDYAGELKKRRERAG